MDESKISNNESLDQGSSHVNLGGIGDSSDQTFLEKTTAHITESFIVEGGKKLSSFLRKKITLELGSINNCLFESIEHKYKKSLMVGFEIEADSSYGLIGFDFTLLHTAINLLFGGTAAVDEPIMDHLGLAGIKITNKIAEICVLAFQNALNEHLNTDVNFSRLPTSLYSVFNQKPDKCCNLDFKVSLDSVPGNLWVVIPERVLANITPNSTLDMMSIQENPDQGCSINGQLKDGIIDSKVVICAVLSDIALLVKDVVNLRAGDIIPIDDPTFVYVTHNQKKLFTATAGQLNAGRIVKIIDPV